MSPVDIVAWAGAIFLVVVLICFMLCVIAATWKQFR